MLHPTTNLIESNRYGIQPQDNIMTADNFDQLLTELRDQQPFRIFTVELHGGRRFEVDQPHALIVREGVAVFLAPGGIPIYFDHDSVNQVIHAGAKTDV